MSKLYDELFARIGRIRSPEDYDRLGPTEEEWASPELFDEERGFLRQYYSDLVKVVTLPPELRPPSWNTTVVKAGAALYIKLGEGGRYEQQCIEQDQTLKLGYEEASHALCLDGKWEEVRHQLIEVNDIKDTGVATRHVNQIKLFYATGEKVLWITFYKNRLWWCFSKPEVTVLNDGSKTRPVVGHWSCYDAKRRKPLDVDRLSGKLLRVQRFQGTICHVGDLEYLLRRINEQAAPEVEAAELAVSSLVEAAEKIVRNLHWRDFELLIDLIFRQAGWQRVSELGGPQRTLDLVLEAPVTRGRYGVQVKSQADLQSYANFLDAVQNMEGFRRFYFVVHSPERDLEQIRAEDEDGVKLLRPAEIAKLAVDGGLVQWIIDKAG